mmetsp:Transcript_64769/g.154657  ORF Transcript_64769/g.154657 Transcript_64769/m.154657 type:complete len:102 (+) Transcript_64769:55-360(+)
MFAGAMMLLQLGGQYDGDFETNPYGSQYASKQWINNHMLTFCKAGSESGGTMKQCIAVGQALPQGQQQKYVHQLAKGCFPGVISAPGGRRCDLPGWQGTDW